MIDFDELSTIEDDGPPPDWNFDVDKPGWLKFYVYQNVVDEAGRVFEIEVIDYDGCVQWMAEGMGIEFWLEEHHAVHAFREGCTYELHNIIYGCSPGDGWEIDADEWFEEESFSEHWTYRTRLSQIIKNRWHWWVVCPLREWRTK